MECPCKDCICIPICRHKKYLRMFGDCIDLRKYEPSYNMLDDLDYTKILAVQDILNPTVWGYGKWDKNGETYEYRKNMSV